MTMQKYTYKPKKIGVATNLHLFREIFDPRIKFGARVSFRGRTGTIIGTFGAFLKIAMDGDGKANSGLYHPTIELKYIEDKVKNEAKVSAISINDRRQITIDDAAKLAGYNSQHLKWLLRHEGLAVRRVHSCLVDEQEFEQWLKNRKESGDDREGRTGS